MGQPAKQLAGEQATPLPSKDWRKHNPGLLSRQELIERFLIRHQLLVELEKQLRDQPSGVGLRHLILIGQRGVGKTTMLRRLSYLVEDDPKLSQLWQPVLFAEEQYNIGDLADLLSEILRCLGESGADPQVDLRVTVQALLRQRLPDQILCDRLYAEIVAFCQRRGRRLVLFIDNINMILGQLREQEAHRLRQILMTEPHILVIGAAPTYFSAITEYDKPFYDFFRIFRLEPLSESEMQQFLHALATFRKDTTVLQVLAQHPARVRSLHHLTGGNPRIALFLYGLLSESPSSEIRRDLERLLDEITPFYKDRLEHLAPQQRRVFDAIARHWHPVAVGELTESLRLPSNAVSVHIRRLIDEGYVEVAEGSARQKRYQVAERMYSVYYLMRFSRSGRQQLQWFVEFLQTFYEQESLRDLAVSWVEKWKSSPPSEAAEFKERAGNLGLIVQAITCPQERTRMLLEMATCGQQSEMLANLAAVQHSLKNDQTAFQALLAKATEDFVETNSGSLQKNAMYLASNGQAAFLLATIDQHQHLDLAERWLPLYAALEVLTGRDPERMAKLAPEVRQVAERCLEQIRDSSPFVLSGLPHLVKLPADQGGA